MRVGLDALGLVAPGLPGWSESRDRLLGEVPFEEAPLPKLTPKMLPANESRRTTATIRIALQAATEACENSDIPPDELAVVFASSGGDLEIVDRICSALALPDRPVSPTLFHNSVHNAPAGYWHIGSGAMHPSTSLSAREGSFAAGLLEAATLVMAEERPALLVAYDYPAPPRLRPLCPGEVPFAVACVLRPDDGAARVGSLLVSVAKDGVASRMPQEALERIRVDSAAARALPLLAVAAAGKGDSVVLPYLPELQLKVAFQP